MASSFFYVDAMETQEYLRYIQLQKHTIHSIRTLMRELDIAEFETFPIDYEGLMSLYDDIRMLRHSPHAISLWRERFSFA